MHWLKLHLRLYVLPEICISLLSCCDWLRKGKWGSFEFGSGRIQRYSSIGVENIISEFITMIYEQISAKETCRIGVGVGLVTRETKVMPCSPGPNPK